MSIDEPLTGGGAYTGVIVRQVGSDFYQARVRYFTSGSVGFQLLQGGSTVLVDTVLPGVTFAPGEVMVVKAQAFGVAPTTIRAKAWKAGTAEPAEWTVTTTSSAAGLQAAGSVGQISYLSASATNAPLAISYDNFLAVAGHGDGGPVNVGPMASFVSPATDLVASFDSSASADSDGSLSSWLWDFGDGQTSTDPDPAHTYAAAGTYLVSLTVTDDSAAISTAVRSVTVAAVAGPPAVRNPVTAGLSAATLTYDGHGNTVRLADQVLGYDVADRHMSTTLDDGTVIVCLRDVAGRIVSRTATPPAGRASKGPGFTTDEGSLVSLGCET